MGNRELEEQFRNLLNDAAKKICLQKFSIEFDLDAQKGDGFLGELYKATITDEETNEKNYVVMKKAPTNEKRRDETCIDMAYENEIYFYSVIYPFLKKFQEERHVSTIFNNVPFYITSCREKFNEMIVLEDITKKGYKMTDKNILLNEEHVKFIFETYGRFHAISYCAKDQLPEDFNKISKSIPKNVAAAFGEKSGFSHAIQGIVEKSFAALDVEEDSDVCENFKKYTEDATSIYKKAVQYKGQHGCILHGDCWSNNMMFKYEDFKLTDIKLLDFQLIWLGTPVYDLSYFFYSGGSYDLFKKLEYYLDIYYASFSTFARELGSDPQKLLPRQVLTEDWKEYAKFGMLMALLLTQVKLANKEEYVQSLEAMDKDIENRKKLKDVSINEQLFNQRIKDILNHMYEMNAL